MKRIIVALGLCLALASTTAPAFAAGTGLKSIAWIKIKPNGVMLALADFDLADADPNTCADPGLPYFWMPNTVDNFEERYAALLSALNGDRQLTIAYWDCGGAGGTATLLELGNVTVF